MNKLLVSRPGIPPCLPDTLPGTLEVAEAARLGAPEFARDGAFPDREISTLYRAGMPAVPLDAWLWMDAHPGAKHHAHWTHSGQVTEDGPQGFVRDATMPDRFGRSIGMALQEMLA